MRHITWVESTQYAYKDAIFIHYFDDFREALDVL